MIIKQLAEKYGLTKDDFWELRKNSNKWIITHDACEKIAVQENIVFEPMEVVSYIPSVKPKMVRRCNRLSMGGKAGNPLGQELARRNLAMSHS